jgi:hypothetical protein
LSVITDGILFYGIPYDDDTELPRIEDEVGDDLEFDDHYLIKVGFDINKRDATYYERRSEALSKCPCEVGIYCSFDYPMYYVATESYHVSRGYAKEIPAVITDPAWDKQIEDYCRLMGFPLRKPGWFLVSLWG